MEEIWKWIVDTLRTYPELAIFLTIGLGFWIGKWKFKSFSLGTVTSVLLVGVLVGQLDIPISGPLKSVFFLLFLFAIGYSVGPQFFRSLRGSGLKEVIFAVIICLLCLGITWGVAKAFKYDPGTGAGLFAGAQTISAVIGVATDTIGTLGDSAADKQKWLELIPVAYAVTYVFGTIGSAWILGNLGPKMLGGLDKVRKQTKELEAQLSHSDLSDDPAYIDANRPVVFRAYKADSDFFASGATVSAIEEHLSSLGRRVFVERLRIGGVITDPAPATMVNKGDEIVLSGRREYVIQDESWIGPEVDDAQLLTFDAEKISVVLAKKAWDNQTVDYLRSQKFMYGIMITGIGRSGVQIPVLPQTKLQRGDTLSIIGLKQEVDAAAPQLGYADRPTTKTDLVFVGLAIFIGGIIGALTVKAGGIPISLSTSGGALIAGLFFGWLRSKRPTFGAIPQSSIWLLNNLGLNMFIAVIGITSGPTFISGIKEIGIMIFVAGILCTSLPLLIGIFLGDKVFKFHPAINLGCCAGGRTTTAALGAIQDSLQSSLPAMGYTITYAIGNTLLILSGVAMVLMM
ncbi:MAG: aspartate-alanine antiporter, partial [Muribaculaceae bacterium]|nr:aspartate-alanine antiporter [Muribaculaceae bacterium]